MMTTFTQEQAHLMFETLQRIAQDECHAGVWQDTEYEVLDYYNDPDVRPPEDMSPGEFVRYEAHEQADFANGLVDLAARTIKAITAPATGPASLQA